VQLSIDTIIHSAMIVVFRQQLVGVHNLATLLSDLFSFHGQSISPVHDLPSLLESSFTDQVLNLLGHLPLGSFGIKSREAHREVEEVKSPQLEILSVTWQWETEINFVELIAFFQTPFQMGFHTGFIALSDQHVFVLRIDILSDLSNRWCDWR
jgi:hypothetical protein